MVNVDVSNTTFWHVASFPMIVNQLTGHMDLDTVQTCWRDQGSKKLTWKYEGIKRLRANFFQVEHKGRSKEECKLHRP